MSANGFFFTFLWGGGATRKDGLFGMFGVLGFNASATARVISTVFWWKSVFWWRKPEYPEKPTDLRQHERKDEEVGGVEKPQGGGLTLLEKWVFQKTT